MSGYNYNVTDSKKNKESMVRKNNNRIAMREFEEAEFTRDRHNKRLDVDRIMLERQMTSSSYQNDQDANDKQFGELTGDAFDQSDIYDKGMPYRSSFTVKKSRFDDNKHLDFTLFSKTAKIDNNDNNIEYNDTYSGDYAGLDEALKPITSGVNPYEVCVSNVNTTTCWMHSNLFNISNNMFIVNGFGLFAAFGAVYLISHGKTEIELKNYFGYQDKKHLNAGLLTIRENINKCRDQIIIDNYIINDKTITSNSDIAKKIKSLIFNIVINKNYPNEEANRVNGIIQKISNLDNLISPNTISRVGISLISIAKITPIWAYKVDNVIKTKSMSYIKFIGKTYDYYEDSDRQLIEIPLHNSTIVLGMIVNKKQLEEPTNFKILTTCLNYVKPTVLDEVLIPCINTNYKIRLNQTLAKTGIVVVFNENETSSLYPEGGMLDDCLQYIYMNFGTKCGNKKCNNTGYRTTRKFMCNGSFEFYFRDTSNNCILIFGKY